MGLAQDVKFCAVDTNLYILQFFCLGDWEKVMERGPWWFRDWAVVIAPYDGFAKPESIELEFIPFWIQIHGLPKGYRKKEMVEKLAARVGKISIVEMNLSGGFKGDFVRLRVRRREGAAYSVRVHLKGWQETSIPGQIRETWGFL